MVNSDMESRIENYDSNDLWPLAMRASVHRIRELGHEPLAYGFYERNLSIRVNEGNFGQFDDEVFVPFLLIAPNNYEEIERASIYSNNPVKISSSYFELGDVGNIDGIVSKDSILLSRGFPNFSRGYVPEHECNIICIGEKGEDGFYTGFWGYKDREKWQGNFKMVFDISSPFNFD